MKFTMQQIKEISNLKKSTGYGMLDCRKALIENDWNTEKAKEWLDDKYKYSNMISF